MLSLGGQSLKIKKGKKFGNLMSFGYQTFYHSKANYILVTISLLFKTWLEWRTLWWTHCFGPFEYQIRTILPSLMSLYCIVENNKIQFNSHNLSPFYSETASFKPSDLQFPSTKLTRYQLICPAWIIVKINMVLDDHKKSTPLRSANIEKLSGSHKMLYTNGLVNYH